MPDWNEENNSKGLVCGIDEAGRGPWAGPVVAGAVVFLTHEIDPYLIENLDDSKKLSRQKREILFDLIQKEAAKNKLFYAIGEASAKEIDTINILQATFSAMKRAFDSLPCRPDLALVDGNRKPPQFDCMVKTIVKGDSKSYSVSAASIVAKVYRDRLMNKTAQLYPGYGFEKNAGYGTKAHIEGLKKLGVCPEHRRSYKPVAEFLKDVSL